MKRGPARGWPGGPQGQGPTNPPARRHPGRGAQPPPPAWHQLQHQHRSHGLRASQTLMDREPNMSDTQPTRASKNSNTAEYVVVACLFAGLAGALAYGMYIRQPDMPPAPAPRGAGPPAAAPPAPGGADRQ